MKKYLLISIGMGSFLLGAAGVVVPLLPTTPFLLLAGYCFSRSSDSINDWLKQTKVYQMFVSDYVETRTIPRKKKWRVLLNVYVLMTISILLAPLFPVKVGLVCLTLLLTIMILFVIPDRK
ncbi:YbaN family protein [Marinilactibacillus kalidii]|uniref:YbaN family protein n=1 Tax=Marinilactibacillus kalidii TaxID=2820274 RepID=UPI001ABE1E2D|nr:YbaN family protein [Marinilactibacillus kalidii]